MMKKILLASACILAPSTAGALAQTQPAPGASSEGNVGPTTRHSVTTRHNTKRGVTTGSAAASEHQEVDQRFLCACGCLDVGSAMTKPVGKTRQKPDRQNKIHQDKHGGIGQHGRTPAEPTGAAALCSRCRKAVVAASSPFRCCSRKPAPIPHGTAVGRS